MVSPEINIKRASARDAQLISDLSTITFIETYRGTCADEDITGYIGKYFNEDVIAAEIEDPDDLYYIAFADGFPAGYMRLKEENGEYPLSKKHKAIHLKRIYILQEYQSNHIGSALMSFALQLAAENNYEVLWLGVWEGNAKARCFYKKWGFEDINQPYSFSVGNTVHTDRWMTKAIEKL